MNPHLRHLLVVSWIAAALAVGVPWLTHFADRGLWVGLPLLWLGLAVTGLV